MGSELGQDAVYHQAVSFVDSAQRTIEAREAEMREAGRLRDVSDFFDQPMRPGGTTMSDEFVKVFEDLGKGMSHRGAVQFVITDGEPIRA